MGGTRGPQVLCDLGPDAGPMETSSDRRLMRMHAQIVVPGGRRGRAAAKPVNARTPACPGCRTHCMIDEALVDHSSPCGMAAAVRPKADGLPASSRYRETLLS